jgi:DNA-binding transcriptional MerR regulator
LAKKTDSVSLPEWKPSVHDINLLLPQLHEPRYPIQVLKQLDPKLTYRKLHSWERSRLISPKRKTKATGWRKFSFAEAVLLLMISDLKHLGFATPVICRVLTQLTSPLPGVSWLEIFLVSSIRGGCYIFLINGAGSISTPMNLEGLLHAVRPDEGRGPLVLCPLYEYVRRVLSLTQTEVTFTNSLEPRRLSSQEKKLLSIIANQDYEKIEITKADGKVKTVRAVSRKKGKLSVDDVILSLQAGDFREVTATTNDGNIVTIKATDKYKL